MEKKTSRLAAGLCPDPLGDVTALPTSSIAGLSGEGRGNGGKGWRLRKRGRTKREKSKGEGRGGKGGGKGKGTGRNWEKRRRREEESSKWSPMFHNVRSCTYANRLFIPCNAI